MPKIDKETQQEIAKLSREDLAKLVVRAASKSKEFYDFLLINYLDKEYAEKDLFLQAQNDIKALYMKNYKGFSVELRWANMLAACNKRIIEFSKVAKDKSLEMDLIMMVLEEPFSQHAPSFATCFTKFNYQVYLLLKKAMTLSKKLHEDYHIQYIPKINEYLEHMHECSNHLDYVYALPDSI